MSFRRVRIFGGSRVGITAALIGIALSCAESEAAFTFSASGNGLNESISASVTFDFVNYAGFSGGGANCSSVVADCNAVQVTLRNTVNDDLMTGHFTTDPANILTGVLWTMNPTVGPLGDTAATFDGRADLYSYGTPPTVQANADIAPQGTPVMNAGWDLSNGFSRAGYTSFNYGIGTIGGGGLFGQVDGDPWGITADNQLQNAANWSNPVQNQSPLIDGSATFYITRPAGWTSFDTITQVRFIYGSTPAYILDTNTPLHPNDVPEPGSLALLALGLAGLWGFRNQRKSQA